MTHKLITMVNNRKSIYRYQFISTVRKFNHQFKTNFYCQIKANANNQQHKRNQVSKSLLESLNNCIITRSHDEVFEAEEIVFHENLIKNKAEEHDSKEPVGNHDLQQTSLACGNGGVWFFHEISPGACTFTGESENVTMSNP